jgi:hypothetical protein
LRNDAYCVQCRCDLIGHSPMRRLRDLVPEHRAGPGLARELGDDPDRRPFAQHEGCAERGEAALQGPQRLCQPPARRAAKRARGRRAQRLAGLVEYVKANHRLPGFGSRVQSGMIGKAQIVAKPDNAGGSGCSGHQGRSIRKAWVRVRTLQLYRSRYVSLDTHKRAGGFT